MLSHESRSRQIVGEREQEVLTAAGAPIDSEGNVPGNNVFPFESEGENPTYDLEIPFEHVEALNAGMRVPMEVDTIYDDDQYKDDPVVVNGGV